MGLCSYDSVQKPELCLTGLFHVEKTVRREQVYRVRDDICFYSRYYRPTSMILFLPLTTHITQLLVRVYENEYK